MARFFTSSHRFLVLTLIGLSFIFLMFGNDLVSLTHPDEVFYTLTAQEMLEQKTWMTPYIFGQPQFEKPIFFYWLLAVAIKWFGAVPFAMRFWPAFFGMAGVIVVYWMAWMLFRSKRLAFLAGFILSTSFIYLGLSRAVLTDMVFSFWVVTALACFYWAYTAGDRGQRKSIGIILFFACCGLAVLTKGVLGIWFPAMVVYGYLRYRNDRAFFDNRAGKWGLFLFILIASSWHLWMAVLYGKVFLHEYWYNVHLRRIFEAEHPRCDTWYFYPASIIGGMLPWTFFLVPALYLIVQKIRTKEKEHRSQILFLIFWILGVLVFQQIAKSKLTSYILPVFSAFAIIIAYYFHQRIDQLTGASAWRGLRRGGYSLAGFLAVSAVAAIILARKHIDFVGELFPVYVFAALSLTCAVILVISLRRQKFLGILVGTSGMIVALLSVIGFGHRGAEPWVSCKQISEVLKQTDSSNSVVLASKYYARAVRFYTGRNVAVVDLAGKRYFSPHPIPFLNNDDVIVGFLQRQPVTYGIVRKGNVADLERIVKQGPFVLTTVTKIGDKFLVKIDRVGPVLTKFEERVRPNSGI